MTALTLGVTLSILGGLTLVINLTTLVIHHVRNGRRRRKLEESITELKDVSVEALAEAALEREKARKERERADGYFRYFQQIEKERNEWRELYHEAGTGMSRGQSLLMNELVRITNLCKRHKIDARPDPKIAPMVEKYVATHGQGAPAHDQEVKEKAHDPLALVPATPPPVSP